MLVHDIITNMAIIQIKATNVMSVVMSGFPETGKASCHLLLVPNVKVHTGTSLKETSND